MASTNRRRARQMSQPVVGTPGIKPATDPRVPITERQRGRLEESYGHLQQAEKELRACAQYSVFAAAQRSFKQCLSKIAEETGCSVDYQFDLQAWEFLRIEPANAPLSPESLPESTDPDVTPV